MHKYILKIGILGYAISFFTFRRGIEGGNDLITMIEFDNENK